MFESMKFLSIFCVLFKLHAPFFSSARGTTSQQTEWSHRSALCPGRLDSVTHLVHGPIQTDKNYRLSYRFGSSAKDALRYIFFFKNYAWRTCLLKKLVHTEKTVFDIKNSIASLFF
jgi:hypothetical protein